VLRIATERARRDGTSVLRSLVHVCGVDEAAVCREIAREFGLAYLDRIDPGHLLLDDNAALHMLQTRARARTAALALPGQELLVLLSPEDIDLEQMRGWFAGRPSLGERLAIVPPTVLRAAVTARAAETMSKRALSRLFDDDPSLSARFVMTGRQGVVCGGLAVGALAGFVAAPAAAWIALTVVFAMLFIACIALRVGATLGARPPRRRRFAMPNPAELPVYSVLVALHHEAEIVPQLLQAMGRLQWPRQKLEIKFVCEADDRSTIDALRAHALHACVEIVEVPPGLPRTKPKALAHALQLCKGEFVALYDAEDRPEPLQLVEAWLAFRDRGDDLACVQAPLVVTNGGEGILQRMFAFEYSALFGAMLPWLSQGGLVFPLGGTSNHFRRDALERAQGWDPYNVTEDADLGLRLARFGLRAETITLPTYEDAPRGTAEWVPQRTRWFKGWMQTWLVHMRQPLGLLRDLGPASFMVAQVLFLGMVASALVHPFFLGTLLFFLAKTALAGTLSTHETVILVVDFLMVSLGYAAFITLGARTMQPGQRRHVAWVALMTPVYWLLLSYAAWKALAELVARPHHWNKTPHRRAWEVRSARP
jgi:cellulose synthase/poly-beta-1,6-N-acetylglucosamine synthase-like glycosyltransferase